jgi:hypothetical protein
MLTRPPQRAQGPLTPEADAAVECAAQAARRFGMTRRGFRECVIGTSRQLEKYSRVVHRIERRTAVLRTLPASVVDPDELKPLPHPERVKPWQTDGDTLRQKTEIHAICPSCSERRADSQEVHSACATCEGSGVVLAWLDIQRSFVEQVRAHPEFMAVRVHPAVLDADDFDCAPHPGKLDEDTGWRESMHDLSESLSARLDMYCDRVLESRLQSFVVAIHSVTYRTPQGRGTIEVAGRQPRVLPLSSFRPLELRLATIGIASALYAVAAVALPLAYSRQDSALPTLPILCWAIALATAFVIFLRSDAVWHVLRRSLPRRFGGRSRHPNTTGTITQTFGTR